MSISPCVPIPVHNSHHFFPLVPKSMPGGDFVTVEFDNNVAKVVDRWNDKFGLPKPDCSQDWTLVKFERQASGRAVAELRRSLNTSDVQDRPIVAGETRILFAWGSESTPAYHDNNRGLDTISFIPSNVVRTPLPADGANATLIFDQFLIPAQQTTYACKSFELPNDVDYHIVSIESTVSAASAEYVHHFLAYLCTYEFNNSMNYAYTYQNASQCPSPIGSPVAGCSMVLYTWASGVGELRLPAAAGFRVSGSTNYILLEVHYNNPSLRSGVRDSSGIKVIYTPTLREHDAATLVLGDPLVQFPPINPGQEADHREASCPSECTSSWPHDINVFGSLLHMHMHGRSMWTTQWRNGSRIGSYSNRVDFYSYHLQQSTPITRVIRRGDQLNTHCVFQTRDATHQVRFGIETMDEMCMDFVTYYPRLVSPSTGRTMTLCGYISPQLSVCGDPAGEIIPVANPATVDPEVDQIRPYGIMNGTCAAPLASPMASPVASPVTGPGATNQPGSRSPFMASDASTLTYVANFSLISVAITALFL
jgi:hypothetical protein